MKKSTLILLVVALGLGAFVYYYEFKRKPAAPVEEDKPAFTMQAGEVVAMTIARGGTKVSLEKHGTDWAIKQPVETGADGSVVEGIATNLATARIGRTITVTPDRLEAFGLLQPALKIEFKLKSGAQHHLVLGAKDFSTASVYGIVDGAKDVVLLPTLLLTAADKPLDELRDRSVLAVASSELSGFDLKNKAGQVAAKKDASGWRIEKPRATAADSSEVESLLAQVTSAKMAGVVSETATNLGKYRLEHPGVVFRGRDVKGQEHTLSVGQKDGVDYDAHDSARPMIFRISDSLYKKLGESFSDLRDKAVIHLDRAQINHVEIHNKNQTVVCEQGKDGKWTLVLPADSKGKEVQSWRFFDPIDNARAKVVSDSPSGDVLARLAKPAVEVTFTDPSGKTTKVSVSAVVGDSVYVRTSVGPTVYKLGKQVLEDLNFKAKDLLL
jgi:hypothetical protein